MSSQWRVIRGLCIGMAFASTRLDSASLPGALSVADIDRLTQLLAMGGVTRLHRSAESSPAWPGVKVGMELLILPANRLGGLGDGNSSVNYLLPNPRLVLAKGLFPNTELIVSIFPAWLNSVAGLGGIFKWTLLNEADHGVSVAGTLGLSAVNAFRREFEGTCFSLGAVVSRDYVRLRPYAGGALIFARGQVDADLALSTRESGALLGTQVFLGAEVELPVNLSVQLDLVNLDPTLSVFIGKRW